MVIIDTDKTILETLCDRLEGCRNTGDSMYCEPISNKTNDQWFVQILDKDVVHLTPDEFAKLQDVPEDWFEDEF